jgi:hypothetical protein
MERTSLSTKKTQHLPHPIAIYAPPLDFLTALKRKAEWANTIRGEQVMLPCGDS